MNLDIGDKPTAPADTEALQIGCLSAPVTVWRDEWGIPHIKAATSQDAFAALGVVHAQDRLWQMDALRRRVTGRYAEWMGPSALAGDILARQLDGAGASQRDYAALGRALFPVRHHRSAGRAVQSRSATGHLVAFGCVHRRLDGAFRRRDRA